MMRQSQSRALNRRALIPFALIGSLLFVLLVGYLIGEKRQYLLGGLFLVLPLTLFALRAFDRLVLAIPLVALLIPFSLPTGSGSRVSAVMLLIMLLLGIWLLATITGTGQRFARSPLNKPLITFAIVCTLALIWSVAFRDPLLIRYPRFIFVQLGGLAAMVLSPVAALLIAQFVTTPQRLWWIAAPFIVVGVVHAVTGIFGITPPLLNTRGLFPLWFVAVGYALLISQPRLHVGWRIALAVVLLLELYLVTIVNILWLSGWAPPLTAILAITLFRSRRAFLALLIVLALLVMSQWAFLYKNIFEDSQSEGDFQRLTLWQLNIELISNHPLLGAGPAGYALYYVTYNPQEARSTHNNYLDIIAQTGLIGSAAWLWIVAASIREGYMALKYAPPGSLRTLALASAGGLVGAAVAMALGDWIIPFAYNQGIEGYRYTVFSWLFLGVLMSIRQQVAPIRVREERRYATAGTRRFSHSR